MNLHSRLLLGILPVVFIATVGVGLLTMRLATNSLLDQIRQNTILMSEGFADELNTQLVNRKRMAQSLAADIPMSINVGDTLRSERRLFPEYRSIFYVSPRGELLNMSPYEEAFASRDFSQDPEWREALETGRPVLSTVHDRLGYPAVTVTTPVLLHYTDAPPEVQGVIVISIEAADVFAKINRVEYGASGLILIFDNDFRVLNRDGAWLFDLVEEGALDDDEKIETIFQAARERQTGWGVVEFEGEEYYVAFAPVMTTDWTLVFRGPLQELTADIDRLAGLLITVVGVALLLASAIIFLSVRGVTHPIRQLTMMLSDVASHGLPQNVEVTSSDEVGQLAGAFNQMTGRIGQLLEQLRYRLGFEELVLRLSTDFLRLRQGDALDDWLAMVLADCASFTGADQGFVCLFDEKNSWKDRYFLSWERGAGVNKSEEGEDQSSEYLRGLREQLEEGETIYTEAPDALPAEAALYRDRLKALGIGASLIVPFHYGGGLRGYMELRFQERQERFGEEDIALLHLLEEIISAVLERFDIEEELRLYREDLEQMVEERTERIRAINVELREQIEERALAEEARGESEARYRTLIEQSVEAIYLVEPKTGRIIEHNRAFLDILGYDAADVERLKARDFILSSAESIGAFVAMLEAEGFAHPTECAWRTREGTTREMQLTGRVIVEQGQRYYFIVARDITEQKLLQSRLVLADRLASLGTLAAGVAHEINNPLAFVISNLDFLKDELSELRGESFNGQARDELLHILSRTEEGAERMRRIVSDLRAFAHGGNEELSAVDPETVLESTLSLATSELRHHATIERRFEGCPPVRADVSRLGQVFLNLLVNALQALPSDRSPEKNRIIVESSTTEAGAARIAITDNGVGILPENMARIFDPFFTTKQVGVGIGLGLFICHNIVASFGGTLSVESKVGEGTTFQVILPAAEMYQSLEAH